MTKVEQILNRFKNHPIISIVIVIGIAIISLAAFKDALQNLFVQSDEKTQTLVPVARFPFDLQMRNAKERIRYLSQEYLKTDTISLVEVVGAYGDNVLDSPQLYDWDKVINELEREGYIKVLRRTGNNIMNPEFKVLLNSATEPIPTNVRLTNDAWKAYNAKKYEQAISKAEECINEFEGDAIPEQEELEKSSAPLPPLDKVSEEEIKVIISRGLLNDVATCWLIKGSSLEKREKIQEAIKAYCKAAKFTYARTYDKSEGDFWSPSEKAKNRISYLKGQCE